ncbi:nucleotidyltransferase domain-containing protein [Candidatus Woesearchaeota archaeon]|nr:nucleotidyltransferase domain-containing protein [Candidatus Woesearchaeota archaeon]
MHELMLLKVVKFFLENPYEEVYLRQLAKKLKLSPFAIKKYSDLLIKENLIKEEKKANLRYFKANTNNLFFKQLKISNNISIILKLGLIEFLKENVSNVSSIVLFGSMAKGEDDKDSDVDLLIIGKEKHLNLIKIEEKIKKRITPHIISWSEWNKKATEDIAFYHEVVNYGINLYGELPLVKWK